MIATDGSLEPVLSTDALSALIEDLQFTLGEGPCFDATTSRVPVLVSDLGGTATRWPAFSDEAISAGIRAVFAFPLGVGSTTLGTLDMYRRSPGPLAVQELSGSLVMADTVGQMLAARRSGDGRDEPPSLRMIVHQAAGMVMVQRGGTIEDALLVLRATAYGEGLSINELAADVLARRRRYDKEQR